MLKLFLKLPLVTKIVLKNDKKSMEIDRHIEYNRVTCSARMWIPFPHMTVYFGKNIKPLNHK